MNVNTRMRDSKLNGFCMTGFFSGWARRKRRGRRRGSSLLPELLLLLLLLLLQHMETAAKELAAILLHGKHSIKPSRASRNRTEKMVKWSLLHGLYSRSLLRSISWRLKRVKLWGKTNRNIGIKWDFKVSGNISSVLVRSLKWSVMSLASFQFDANFWGVERVLLLSTKKLGV